MIKIKARAFKLKRDAIGRFITMLPTKTFRPKKKIKLKTKRKKATKK